MSLPPVAALPDDVRRIILQYALTIDIRQLPWRSAESEQFHALDNFAQLKLVCRAWHASVKIIRSHQVANGMVFVAWQKYLATEKQYAVDRPNFLGWNVADEFGFPRYFKKIKRIPDDMFVTDIGMCSRP
jgi:hypothetical protein